MKNGHKWPSSHRSVEEEAKKIPDEIYDTADTSESSAQFSQTSAKAKLSLTFSGFCKCIQLARKSSYGSIVYINRHSPAPPAPPPGSSEATILEYDRANLGSNGPRGAREEMNSMSTCGWSGYTSQMTYQVGDNHIIVQMSSS
jgi:hypothetical protein